MRVFRSAPIALDRELERSWLRRLGVVLVAAKVAIVPLVFDPFAAITFALPKASASRALLYALTVLLAAYVVRRGPRAFGWSPLWLGALPFAALNVAATATALHAPTALHGAMSRFLGLTALADGLVLALAIGVFMRAERDRVVVAVAGLSAAAVALAYGIAQAAGLDPIPWDNPPSVRIFSTIGNAGPFAGYVLTVGTAAAATLVLAGRRLGARIRIAMVGFISMSVLGIALSGTRASLLALPFAALAVVAVAARAGVRVPRLPGGRGLLALGASAAVPVALLAVLLLPAAERAVRLVTGGDSSTRERAVIYEVALQAIRQHPALGVGPDSFVVVFPTLRPPETGLAELRSVAETSTHSWALKVATDAGLPALAAFCALVVVLLASAWRRVANGDIGAAAAGTGLVAFLGQGAVTTSDVSTDWLFWVAAGVLAAPAPLPGQVKAGGPQGRRGRSRERRSRGGPVDLPFAIAAGVVAAVLAFTTLNVVTASRLLKASGSADGRGDSALAVRLARDATVRDAGRGDYWAALAAALSGAGDQQGAVVAMRRATEVTPYVAIYWTSLAETELALVARGRPEFREPALRDADRALALAPSDPSSAYHHARVLQALGRTAEAFSEADALATRLPTEEYVRLAENLAEARSDVSRAIEWQKRFVEIRGGRLADRLVLARLYRTAGDADSARRLLAPPAVVLADRSCSPENSSGLTSDGRYLKRCFRILLSSEGGLVTDPARADSVRRLDNYSLDGQPLPDGSSLAFEPAGSTVTMQLPASASPPRSRAVVSVRNVRDVFGNPLDPSASSAELP